ncbi:MAG TPA: hypothetical protein VKG20_20665 [Methylomirabilota bacterium]|nr:hypothetical protein [Methylomirabilota bacterium]
MQRIGTLERAWRRYAETALPPNASEHQHRLIRRAWYAGARLALQVTDGDAAATDEVYRELEWHTRELLEGRA